MAAGISASRLSTLAGLVRTHVTTIASNPQRGVDLDTAVRLATVLGVSLDWLAQGKGPDPDAATVRAAVERCEAFPLPSRSQGSTVITSRVAA